MCELGEVIVTGKKMRVHLRLDSVMELSIVNNSSFEIMTDKSFEIEYLNGGDWKECKCSNFIEFEDVEQIIKPQTALQFEVDLSHGYANCKDGVYRVVKKIKYKGADESKLVHFTFQVNSLSVPGVII